MGRPIEITPSHCSLHGALFVQKGGTSLFNLGTLRITFPSLSSKSLAPKETNRMKKQAFRQLALALLLPAVSSLQLNVTALGAQDGSSTLECWEMDTPFDISTQPGTSGSALATLSNVSNLTYTILPSGFEGGLHNAPYAQQVSLT